MANSRFRNYSFVRNLPAFSQFSTHIAATWPPIQHTLFAICQIHMNTNRRTNFPRTHLVSENDGECIAFVFIVAAALPLLYIIYVYPICINIPTYNHPDISVPMQVSICSLHFTSNWKNVGSSNMWCDSYKPRYITLTREPYGYTVHHGAIHCGLHSIEQMHCKSQMKMNAYCFRAYDDFWFHVQKCNG